MAALPRPGKVGPDTVKGIYCGAILSSTTKIQASLFVAPYRASDVLTVCLKTGW